MTTDEIFLLENGAALELPARTMRQGILGANLEDALQVLLERFPQIIPGRQIDPGSESPPKFVLLRREAALGAWSLDHLLVDQNGVLTLLECKLAQNAESRRDVIGQIIEYAANARGAWASGKLREMAEQYWNSRGRSVEEVLRESFGLEASVETFWSRVEANLEQGVLRLIVAADELRPEVRRMLEYLNGEMEHVEVLGLELRCYGSSEERVVLVPAIVGQTQARIDRRHSNTEKRVWSVAALRERLGDLEDTGHAARCGQILDWAEKTGSFLQSTAQNAAFGIRGATGRRVLYVYEKEGVYIYTDPQAFAGGYEDLDIFVRQLLEGGLLPSDFVLLPDAKKWGKLRLSDHGSVEQLLSLLELRIR